MLKKIVSIKNVGRFRNSAAAGNPQLAKHTFIVGANGFGKTTICAVLRSLHTGDPSHVLGRRTLGVADAAAVELLLDTCLVRFDGAAWTATHPVAVFDGVFVAEAHTKVVNDAIRGVNTLLTAKKAETAAADVKAAEAELARRKVIQTRHTEVIAKLCADHVGLVAAKDIIDKRKDTIRAKLDKHTTDVVKPYERRINEHLAAFNAGFTITETKHSYPGGIATSSYQLVINNIAVDVGDGKTPTDTPSFKNTLSGGDRTTLALAFFLAHLERTRNWRVRLWSLTTP